MRKEEYIEFLKHPLWLKKRDEVFNYYGKKCSKCGSDKNLQVHHKTYTTGKMPWEYPIENFIVLCEECHANHHGFQYQINKCKSCGRIISKNFSYCLECHNSLIDKKENEKLSLEKKIKDLETYFKNEKNKKLKEESSEIKRIREEKYNLEQKIELLKRSINSEKQRKSRSEEKKIEILKDSLGKKIIELEKQLEKEMNSREDKDREIRKIEKERLKLEKERSEIVEAINELKSLHLNGKKKDSAKSTDENSVLSQIITLRKILLLFIATFFGVLLVVFFSGDRLVKTPENIDSMNEVRSKQEIAENKIEEPIISLNSLKSNIGKYVVLEVVISQVIMAQNGNLYLNIGGRYPNHKMSLVVFPENVKLLPEPEKYEGKKVIIKGKLSLFKNIPQIIIESPGQLTEM